MSARLPTDEALQTFLLMAVACGFSVVFIPECMTYGISKENSESKSFMYLRNLLIGLHGIPRSLQKSR